MILWTFQPAEIYDQIQKDGIYRCDSGYVDPDFARAYDWLVKQMKEKIGDPPKVWNIRYGLGISRTGNTENRIFGVNAGVMDQAANSTHASRLKFLMNPCFFRILTTGTAF